MITAVKGTRDILPPQSSLWLAVEENACRVFGKYGYREIRVPILEQTELFVRSIGEGTDIVNKEMYVFEDRKGRSLCLRPEGTASVARAYIEHNLQLQPHPLRFFYMGPMFRYERPQKGRYRQFYQIGAEILGSESPVADLELLLMVHEFLSTLHFKSLSVLLNSVGCDDCRPPYRDKLLAALKERKDHFCGDCRVRFETNPLRVFDCKVPGCREEVKQLPAITDHLCEVCGLHHDAVITGLDDAGMNYEIEPKLVRGLDYYTRTVFEIVSEDLGAQNAVLGGGRYNRLIQDLGGKETPATGFAIGEDRLIEILPESFRDQVLSSEVYYLLPLGEEYMGTGLDMAQKMRGRGVDTVLELDGRSAKSGTKYADRMGFRYVVYLGEEEVKQGAVTVKDMASGEQKSSSIHEFFDSLGKAE